MELRDVIIVSTVVREYVPDLTTKFNDLSAFNGAGCFDWPLVPANLVNNSDHDARTIAPHSFWGP